MAKVIAFDDAPTVVQAVQDHVPMPFVTDEVACLRFEIQRTIENCLFTDALQHRPCALLVHYRAFGFIRRRQHGHKVFTCRDGQTIWLLQNGKLYDEGQKAVIAVDQLDAACLRGVLSGIQAFI